MALSDKDKGLSISIASGKGGVGKTSFALNLALVLCQQKQKVCLFDADLGLSNVEVLLDIYPQFSLFDALQGTCTLEQCKCPGPYGLHLISGGSTLKRYPQLSQAEKKTLGTYLLELQTYDFLIIDVGAGISRQIISWLLSVSLPIIMANSEPTSLTDAYALIKMYSKKSKGPLFLWLNQIDNHQKVKKIFYKLKEVSEKNLNLRPYLLGHSKTQNSIQEAVAAQKPVITLFPKSSYSKTLESLAKNLIANKKTISKKDLAYSISVQENDSEQKILSDQVDKNSQLLKDSERINITGIESDFTEYIRNILSTAAKNKASDVHFELHKNQTKIRFREQGKIIPYTSMDKNKGQYVIQHLKTLLSSSAHDIQGQESGYLRMTSPDMSEIMNFKACFYPAASGEHAVLHLINKDKKFLDLNNLGMETGHLSCLKTMLTSFAQGLYLFTGPKASGKTCTLYATINCLLSENTKILSVENPIEVNIEGISQLNLTKESYNDQQSLREIIFAQDPDIIALNGLEEEICTQLAIEGSLLGHKVLATLRSADGLEALSRIIKLTSASDSIPLAVKAIISQRLLGKICPYCKHPQKPDQEKALILAHNFINGDLPLFKAGKGCSKCNFTGYSGQIAGFEILIPTEELIEVLKTSTSRSRALDLAKEQSGFVSIFEDSLIKAVQGTTTLDEVLKNAPFIKLPKLSAMPANNSKLRELDQENNVLHLMKQKNA